MGRFDVLINTPKPTPPQSPVGEEKKESTSASLLANQQTSKGEKKQTGKEANQKVGKEVSQQTSLPINQFASKTLKKFGSYLTPESIKKLKLIATERDIKDYEVLQEAVDQYLARTHQ